MSNHSNDTRPFPGKSPEWLEEHGITLIGSDDAIAKWETCDQTLVAMLSEVARKANEFMQDPDVRRVATEDVFVNGAGERIDPAWCWILDIVTLLAYESTTGERVEGNELPLQQMLDALQAPSRRETSEVLKEIMTFYAPGAN